MKKIQESEIQNKKVILRTDFNVSLENGKVKESFKINSCRQSLEFLLGKGCKVALASHFGRPEGKPDSKFSLAQIQKDASEILGVKIRFVSDCIGDEVKKNLDEISSGEVILLENVRFYPGEEKNDPEFSRKLSENFDIFVNDAFSVCHRDQASVTGIAKILPSFSGIWLQKEVEEMEKAKNNFKSPAVAIIGGAKIETKLPVIKFFENRYDFILVGGKIANEAIDQKIELNEKVILPFDFIDDRLDIGPKTVEKFKEIIAKAKTIVWNGPMGKFEEEKYYGASKQIAKAVFDSQAYKIMGGGETLEILEKENGMGKVDFVSTGGGAMLEYLSGNPMPGIEALN